MGYLRKVYISLMDAETLDVSTAYTPSACLRVMGRDSVGMMGWGKCGRIGLVWCVGGGGG